MERALVKRLYRDETSQETVMLMESTQTKERIKITVPGQKAGILALEAHGLNDRCPLYGMFSQCVGALGAVFEAALEDIFTSDSGSHPDPVEPSDQ